MEYDKGIQEPAYKKVTSLLAQLLDLDLDSEQQINSHIKSFGLHHFFNNLEAFSLAPDNLEKLQALKHLLNFISENDGYEK